MTLNFLMFKISHLNPIFEENFQKLKPWQKKKQKKSIGFSEHWAV